MSETTIADIQAEIASLRREFSKLRAQAAPGTSMDRPDETESLRRGLTAGDKQNGISVSHRITQVREGGGSGNASYSVSLSDATDLPTDTQIAEKIERLILFVQNPMALRALRRLAEPHFEGRDKRRSKADLAESLGVTEAEVEAAMTPLLNRYEVTWGKDASGQEYYEWTGNTFAMTLLIHG